MMLATSQSKHGSASSGILWTPSRLNAYIFYCKTSTRQTKNKYAHLDFQLEIAMKLIAGFSSRKRKVEASLYIGPVPAANENNHENVHMGSRKEKDLKMALYAVGKETVYGCHLCNSTLV